MDRTSALRILGLGDAAAREEIQAAHGVLRAHVAERVARAEGEPARAARREELRALDEVLDVALGGAPGASRGAAPRRSLSPWLVGWSLLATGVAALLAVVLLRDAPAPPPRVMAEGGGGSGSVEGAAEPAPEAWLAARANLPGAELEVRSQGEEALLATGPADGTPLRIDPGRYDLRVRHADCPDVWSRQLGIERGQRVELAPRVCRDTGFLVVRSNVAGDELTIDGRALGSTGPERHTLSAGEHAVRVEKDGYAPWDGTVEVPPAESVTLRATLRSGRASARPPQRPAQVAAAQPAESSQEDDRLRLSKWHETVTKWLLARYDHDLSGRLDTPDEVESIPCAEWQGLEQSYDESGLAVPLTRLYGFDGSAWKENALGFDVEMRGYAYERMKACGLR
jgi:hypothetical protein